jgi:hypothetical protein
MKKIIRVRELSDREIEKLDKRKGFNDFRPVDSREDSSSLKELWTKVIEGY